MRISYSEMEQPRRVGFLFFSLALWGKLWVNHKLQIQRRISKVQARDYRGIFLLAYLSWLFGRALLSLQQLNNCPKATLSRTKLKANLSILCHYLVHLMNKEGNN